MVTNGKILSKLAILGQFLNFIKVVFMTINSIYHNENVSPFPPRLARCIPGALFSVLANSSREESKIKVWLEKGEKNQVSLLVTICRNLNNPLHTQSPIRVSNEAVVVRDAHKKEALGLFIIVVQSRHAMGSFLCVLRFIIVKGVLKMSVSPPPQAIGIQLVLTMVILTSLLSG